MGEGGPRDGEGVDRIGLAARPALPPRLVHEPGRDSHDRHLLLDERSLEAPRDVAHVLEGDPDLSAEADHPAHQPSASRIARRHGERVDHLASGGLHGHGGVALLVRIDPTTITAVPSFGSWLAVNP